MAFHWRFETAEGAVYGEAELPLPDAAATEDFPNQGDAESWIGEAWRALAEAGVAAVSLFEEDRLVYGPMSLSE
jgi:hypothetical protein